MKITIPVSVGELIDKITILQIKAFLSDDEYVHKELEHLMMSANSLKPLKYEYFIQLREVNEQLWKIEDRLRKLEKEQNFGEEFIKLARSVYITNDKRADIKRKINEEIGSHYKEIKFY